MRKRQPYRLPAKPQRSPRRRTSTTRTPAYSNALTVENLSRLLVGLTLGLYILGLLSVNGYLLGLGVSDFTLVRARFIYTGAFIASFGATSIVIPAAFFFLLGWWYGLSRPRGYRRVPRYIVTAVIALNGFLIAPVLFAVLVDFVDPETTLFWNFFWPALIQSALAIVLGFLYIMMLSAYGKRTWIGNILPIPSRVANISRRVAWTAPPAARVTFIAYSIFALTLFSAYYVLLFMRNIYPLVPVQFGGGRPTTVQLLFDHDSVAGAKELGIPFSSTGDVSAPVELTYEGNSSYVIRLSRGIIVQLDKEMISASISKEIRTPSILG